MDVYCSADIPSVSPCPSAWSPQCPGLSLPIPSLPVRRGRGGRDGHLLTILTPPRQLSGRGEGPPRTPWPSSSGFGGATWRPCLLLGTSWSFVWEWEQQLTSESSVDLRKGDSSPPGKDLYGAWGIREEYSAPRLRGWGALQKRPGAFASAKGTSLVPDTELTFFPLSLCFWLCVYGLPLTHPCFIAAHFHWLQCSYS